MIGTNQEDQFFPGSSLTKIEVVRNVLHHEMSVLADNYFGILLGYLENSDHHHFCGTLTEIQKKRHQKNLY